MGSLSCEGVFRKISGLSSPLCPFTSPFHLSSVIIKVRESACRVTCPCSLSLSLSLMPPNSQRLPSPMNDGRRTRLAPSVALMTIVHFRSRLSRKKVCQVRALQSPNSFFAPLIIIKLRVGDSVYCVTGSWANTFTKVREMKAFFYMAPPADQAIAAPNFKQTLQMCF